MAWPGHDRAAYRTLRYAHLARRIWRDPIAGHLTLTGHKLKRTPGGPASKRWGPSEHGGIRWIRGERSDLNWCVPTTRTDCCEQLFKVVLYLVPFVLIDVRYEVDGRTHKTHCF